MLHRMCYVLYHYGFVCGSWKECVISCTTMDISEYGRTCERCVYQTKIHRESTLKQNIPNTSQSVYNQESFNYSWKAGVISCTIMNISGYGKPTESCVHQRSCRMKVIWNKLFLPLPFPLLCSLDKYAYSWKECVIFLTTMDILGYRITRETSVH